MHIFRIMATFLFDEIIFGPVKSRRLGVSLGINLLPVDSKVCSFDCIYCECGWTPSRMKKKSELPKREEVQTKLEAKLREMQEGYMLPDVITFAGNGEPTMHPDFDLIIEDTVALRDKYSPSARIAVLSNASMLHREKVVRALLKVDDNIQKLDSAFEETIQILDRPLGRFNLKSVVSQLCGFQGNVIIQTMFIRGSWNGIPIDNTTSEEVNAWIELLKEIKPRQVMIYTIARDTPADTLEKITSGELEKIAGIAIEAGFDVQVSG